jgi:hypothetical protein
MRRPIVFGGGLVREVVCSAEKARSVSERNTAMIRQRARLPKANHPALAGPIDEYAARQERETQILGTDLIGAVWVLQHV